MRYDPDSDYAYDRTNQASGPLGWTVQVDPKTSYPLTAWAVYFGHRRVEGGFADRESAQRELQRIRSSR